MQRFSLATRHPRQLIDITARLQEWVAGTGIRDGMLLVFVPHTTAAVTINENADPDVVFDLVNALHRLVPDSPEFRHLEGNSAAHIQSSLIGASELLIIEQGSLVLGTWQSVYFCEFDGPRTRLFYAAITPGQSP